MEAFHMDKSISFYPCCIYATKVETAVDLWCYSYKDSAFDPHSSFGFRIPILCTREHQYRHCAMSVPERV